MVALLYQPQMLHALYIHHLPTLTLTPNRAFPMRDTVPPFSTDNPKNVLSDVF